MKIKHLLTIATLTRKHQFRGLERILRTIYHPDKRIGDSFDIVTNYDKNLLIHINSSSFMEWLIFFYGQYEPKTTNLIKRLVRPEFVVADVGANIGMFTLLMATRAKQVVAIEPHPEIFKRLLMNINLNRLTNVETIKCVLSNKSGTTTLQGFRRDQANKTSSRYPTNPSIEIPVKMKMFDEVFKNDRLDFIKIDTDGDDLNVLRGAEKSIRKFRPHIVFEYSEPLWKLAGDTFSMAWQFFGNLKYSLYSINNRGYLEHITDKGFHSSANILAVPD